MGFNEIKELRADIIMEAIKPEFWILYIKSRFSSG